MQKDVKEKIRLEDKYDFFPFRNGDEVEAF